MNDISNVKFKNNNEILDNNNKMINKIKYNDNELPHFSMIFITQSTLFQNCQWKKIKFNLILYFMVLCIQGPFFRLAAVIIICGNSILK